MRGPFLLHHLLENVSGTHPDREAVVDLNDVRRAFNFRAIHEMAGLAAATLINCGLRRGDRVVVYLPKCVEEAVAIFAVSMAGGVFVVANALLVGHQVAHILNDSGTKILITSVGDWRRVRAAIPDISTLRHVLIIDDEPEDFSEASAPAIRFLFGVMRGNGSGGAPQSDAIAEDLVALLYTSGSTGKPRGVMLSHRNLLAGSRIVSKYLELKESDRILSILPFSFDYGLNQWITSVQNCATLVLLQYRFPAELVKAMTAESITGVAGVPLVWAGLTHHTSGLKQNRPATLRYITNSGGAVPAATVRALRQLLPDTRIFLMYGLTEAFRATFLPPEEVERRPTSMGKAIPETEILVINSDGRPCEPHEAGILVQRGPTVSLGYWRNPEKTREILRPHPLIPADEGGGTVCYSGDVVRMDDDRFLYFVARADGQIKSQGYRISPSEIEEVLMASGQAQQAAVIGLPADDAGEKVHAIVVPTDADGFDSDACLLYCAQNLPAYMTPKSLEVVSELPSTPNGKVDYQLLRSERARRTS